MVHAVPGFVPGPADELTKRTLPIFFGVLELLLSAGVTTVAEAAFQARLWRPRLELLRDLAQIRVVHCQVDADLALERTLRRGVENPLRRAHVDDPAALIRNHSAFDRISVDAPWLEVDTTNGYVPGLSRIVAFVNGEDIARDRFAE